MDTPDTLHRPSTSLRRLATTLLALSTAAMAACGDDGQGPEDSARMNAYMEDTSGGASAQTTGGAYGHTGSLTGTASVSIFSDARGWVSLGSPAAFDVSMQSTDSEGLVLNAEVPVGTYTRVRVELTSAQALVTAGSDVGGGVLSADVAVAVGGADNTVLIDKTISPMTVTANSTTDVRFDMNSEVWLDDGAVTAQSAADAAIQSATTVDVN